MKLRLILCAAVLAVSAGLCSCGSDDSSKSGNSDSAVSEAPLDINSVAQTLEAKSEDLTKTVMYNDGAFELNCANLYDCEYSDLTGSFIIYNAGGGKADEISVISRKDGDTAAAEKLLKTRSERRYRDFDGYVPEELPKIQDARIFSVGNYSVLIISDKAGELEKAVKDLLK
jgi:hypothetical protein